MRHPVGRVVFAAHRDPVTKEWIPEYENFTPRRVWFWRRSATDQNWPIRFWTGDDEACNPTLAITTWVGTVIIAYRPRLRSSSPAWFLAEMLDA